MQSQVLLISVLVLIYVLLVYNLLLKFGSFFKIIIKIIFSTEFIGENIEGPLHLLAVGFQRGSGTSFSCPLVAGAMALLRSNENLTPGQIKDRLTSECTKNVVTGFPDGSNNNNCFLIVPGSTKI